MESFPVVIYVDVFSRDSRCVDTVSQQMQSLAEKVGWEVCLNTKSQSTGENWSKTIRKFLLNRSDSGYIFIWFDDLFVQDIESFSETISSASETLNIRSFDYIRFTGRPPANGPLVSDGFRLIEENEAYQCSLVGSMWKVGYLKSFLSDNITPWEIERSKHTGNACGAVSTFKIKNFYIKGQKNIWHYPGKFGDYKKADVVISLRWVVKRVIRNVLLRFPKLYHKIYFKE